MSGFVLALTPHTLTPQPNLHTLHTFTGFYNILIFTSPRLITVMSHGPDSTSHGTDGGLAGILENLGVSHQPNHQPRHLERPVGTILLHS